MAEEIIRDPRQAANFLLRRYRDEPDFEFTQEEAGIVHSAYEGRIPFIDNRPVMDEGSTVEFLRSQATDPSFVASEDEFNILRQTDPTFMERVKAGAEGVADYAGQTLQGAARDVAENFGRPSSLLKAPGTAAETVARVGMDIGTLAAGTSKFIEKAPFMAAGALGLQDDYQSYLAQKTIDQNYASPEMDRAYSERAQGKSVIGLPEGTFMPGMAEVGSFAADPTNLIPFGAGAKAGQVAGKGAIATRAATTAARGVETAARATATPIRAGLEAVERGLESIPKGPAQNVARKVTGLVETPFEAAEGAITGVEKTAQAARTIGEEALTGPSQFTVMERVAKNPDNPSWLRQAARLPIVRSQGLQEAVGIGAGAARGAARGAAIGGGIGLVGSGGEAEGLGGGLALGGAIGAAGGVAGRVSSSGQRKAIAQQADINNLFQNQAKLGLDVERIANYAAKDNRPFLDAATFQRIAPDTQVEFHTRDTFTLPENAGVDAAGAVKAVADKSGRIRMLVNLDDRRATGDTVRHEMIHALMKSPAINKSEGRMAVYEAYGTQGVEARGAEYARRLLMAETDGRRMPTEPEVRAKMDQLRDDSRAADPRAGDLDWAADEILAEQFQGEFRGMDLNDLRRRTPPGTNLARLQEGMLAPLGRALSALGVDVNGPKPANIDSLFADNPLTPSPRLRELTARWFRERDRYLDGIAKAETTKEASIVPGPGNRNLSNNPAITFTRSSRGGIQENDFAYKFPDGTVRLKNQPDEIAGIRAIEAARVKDVQALYDPNKILERGDATFGKKLQADGVQYIGGPRLPEGFYQLESFNDFHKQLAKEYEAAGDTGRTFSIWYQKIGSGDEGSWAAAVKKNLGNLKVGQAEIAPVGWRLSKNGNVLVQAVDITALRGRMLDLRRSGKGRIEELWGGDLDAYQKDLFAYLKNHQQGLPGDAGIGAAKRDAINYLFGFSKGEVNPLVAADGRAPGSLFKSYRLDRIANSRDTGRTGYFIDYGKQAMNLAPGDISLQRAVYEKMPERATPEQVRAIIRPGQARGVNEEDIKWSGVNNAIDRLAKENQGKVPKDKLLEYLDTEGKVRFEEVQYGGDRPRLTPEQQTDLDARKGASRQLSQQELTRLRNQRTQFQRAAGALTDQGRYDEATQALNQAKALGELIDPQPPAKPARFQEYTLPGGTNYREVVLAMPETSKQSFRDYVRMSQNRDPESFNSAALAELRKKYDSGDRVRTGLEYTSTHFKDAPGYIAHMRLTDRADAAGKPGLFMEEVQSDRHQAGREKGYLEDQMAMDKRRAEIEAKKQAATQEERQEWADLMNRGAMRYGGTPDAPFRKDWPVQMFRRALKEAVMDGKEWIGWTTGETQAARYDLSKQIDSVRSYKNEDGTYAIQMVRNGVVMDARSGIKEGELDGVVGKDLAQKIVAGDGTDIGTEASRKMKRQDREFSGIDLKVGGEGMRAFYDQILPNEIQKYVKQWGGKVIKSNLKTPETAGQNKRLRFEVIGPDGLVYDAFPTEELANAAAQDAGRGYRVKSPTRTQETPIWKVEITPEMRDGLRRLDEIEMEITAKSKAIRRQLEPSQ